LHDRAFMAFVIASILMATVYQQMYSSLPVFLRDRHGIDPQGYGLLLSMSGMTVVLFQFWVISRIKGLPPFLMMGAGALFYATGFSLFGIDMQFTFLAINIVIITVGEMIIMPVSQALAASFAPEEMRGRYMAISGMTWTIPSTLGPGLGGYVLDHYDPDLLWYIGGALCIVAAFSFYVLHLWIGAKKQFIAQKEEVQPA
jgi:MFS family permease